LTALHGLDIGNVLYRQYPDFSNKTYKEKQTCLFQAGVLYSNSFSRSMNQLGNEAHEIVWDFSLLQHTWAKENGVPYDTRNWQYQILIEQIRKIRPDIIYFQGTELAIPGRFVQQSPKQNLATDLKKEFPFVRLVAMYSGFPTHIQRTVDVDMLFACTPSIQNYYKRNGVPSVLCYHAFDPLISTRLSLIQPIYDFTFVGSSRVPESRYWMLRSLLENTSIQLWLDEPGKSWGFRYVNIRLKQMRSSIRLLLRGCVKLVFRWSGPRVQYFLVRSSWIPKRIRKVTRSIQMESFVRDEVDTSFNMTTKKGSTKSLKEIYPDRCKLPVSGLDYYRILQSSRVSFNRHTDFTGDSVGNMRMFEATGVGTCLLTDSGDNINDLFEPGVEVVTYSTVEEAIDKSKYLLDNEEVRKEIAQRGYARTLKDHTIENRCQLIDEIIQARL